MNKHVRKVIYTGTISVLLLGTIYLNKQYTTKLNDVTITYEENIQALTRSVEQLESDNVELEQQLQERTAEGRKLEKQVRKLDEESKQLKSELSNKQKKLEELECVRQSVQRTVGYMITPYEYDLLCRLVESEVGIEGATAKRLVAQVVLNRVKSPHFSNTIHGVIHQKNQFDVVRNKSIYRIKPSKETKEIVKNVLLGKCSPSNYLYFFSTDLRKGHPMWTAVSHDFKTGRMIFSTKWNR